MELEEKNGTQAAKVQRNSGSTTCAGTIIDNRTIVTAARCVSIERFREWFGWRDPNEPTTTTTTTTWSTTTSTTWTCTECWCDENMCNHVLKVRD